MQLLLVVLLVALSVGVWLWRSKLLKHIKRLRVLAEASYPDATRKIIGQTNRLLLVAS